MDTILAAVLITIAVTGYVIAMGIIAMIFWDHRKRGE